MTGYRGGRRPAVGGAVRGLAIRFELDLDLGSRRLDERDRCGVVVGARPGVGAGASR
ncbi:hypothetical protein [Natronorubrum sp. A-ect3]|uniref:hypothetical protein n=1 Tax=Natronorubrum sp. A-ect3 TaxID=3242698 RepID=UPI00359DDF51